MIRSDLCSAVSTGTGFRDNSVSPIVSSFKNSIVFIGVLLFRYKTNEVAAKTLGINWLLLCKNCVAYP